MTIRALGRAHQIHSLEKMDGTPIIFDLSDPGTGKTYVQIAAFTERRLRGGGAALVLAPRTLLRAAWELDFGKFAPDIKCSIARSVGRQQAFDRTADVYITNHDAAKWLAKQPPAFFAKFDTLIIDESGAYKHHTSARSKAVKKIVKHFKYRSMLNGTPNPVTIVNIWHQVMLLDDGKRLGSSFHNFRQTVCTPKQVGPTAQMLKWVDRPGAQEAVVTLIEDICIRHKFEDCVDIPENFEHVVKYQLPAGAQRAYKQMEEDAILSLKSQPTISATTAATVSTKLLQIASGAIYNNDGEAVVLDDSRYELVADLIEARQQCVVFFLWTHQRDGLIREFESRGITFGIIDGDASDASREKTVDYFQKEMLRVILAHPKSAAHGLTLTKGTTTIWASPTYDAEWKLQGDKRIYRSGQTQKTETITVVAEDTIDEDVMGALTSKRLNMQELLELLCLKTSAHSASVQPPPTETSAPHATRPTNSSTQNSGS